MKKYQHYIDARGEVLPTPHRNNGSCCDLQIYKGNEQESLNNINYPQAATVLTCALLKRLNQDLLLRKTRGRAYNSSF